MPNLPKVANICHMGGGGLVLGFIEVEILANRICWFYFFSNIRPTCAEPCRREEIHKDYAGILKADAQYSAFSRVQLRLAKNGRSP